MVVVVVLMEQRNFWEAEALGGVQEGKAALGASQGTRRSEEGSEGTKTCEGASGRGGGVVVTCETD